MCVKSSNLGQGEDGGREKNGKGKKWKSWSGGEGQ